MRPWLLVVAVAVLAATACTGCGRVDVLTSRLSNVPDASRRPLSDCLWQSGSVYRWASHRTLRCEITRTDHEAGADVVSREVWLLDTVGGRVRIEKPDLRQVVTYDGSAWRVFVDGRETPDLELRANAGGEAMIARQILPMPFGLLDEGLGFEFAGERIGPAEARTWIRLRATYAGATGCDPADRTLIEINKRSRLVDAAVLTWQESPFLGSTWRVALDVWQPVDGVLIAHRWRFTPADETGAADGRVRWTFEVTAAAWDVPVPWGTFSRP
jgi:hypothetical protein